MIPVVGALRSDDVIRARGIRYARAGRFEPPVAEPETSAPLDASRAAPACVQLMQDPGIIGIDFTAGMPQSEDCLRLSVTTPVDVTDGSSLPVIVWIHGGGYSSGAGDAPAYDPAFLVREQQIVFVSVTYRLGVLGYCGSTTRPWNLGLLDQREALRWVQRNIAAFGGDPDSVTVMGESAGADSILHLMVADGVLDGERPLFHRAIVQSAPVGLMGSRPGIEAAVGPVIDTLPAQGPLGDLAAIDADLRAARRLGRAGRVVYSPEYGHPPLPRVDDAPARLKRAAVSLDVLIGTNRREAAMFLGSPPFRGLRAVPVIGPQLAEAATRLLTRSMFEKPVSRFVDRCRAAGGRVTRYRFLGGTSGTVLRAAHIAELPYLFPTAAWEDSAFIAPSTWEDVARAGKPMRAAWAEFARTGEIPAIDAPGLLELVAAPGSP